MKLSRTEYFRFVRDIPYSIQLNDRQPDHMCNGKHIVLENLLVPAGMEIRPRVCEFKWSDIEQLPKDVLTHLKDDCVEEHVYLEFKKRGLWYVLDVTWDIGLKRTFHVNMWDGRNGTEIAVPQRRILNPQQSYESCNDTSPDEEEEGPAEKDPNDGFYRALNQWLQDIRIGNARPRKTK